MGRNNENANKTRKQGLIFTMRQLNKWHAKYHKLILGKPGYDMIIDENRYTIEKIGLKI